MVHGSRNMFCGLWVARLQIGIVLPNGKIVVGRLIEIEGQFKGVVGGEQEQEEGRGFGNSRIGAVVF